MTSYYYGTVIGESLTDPEVIEEFDTVDKEVSPELDWHLYKVRATKEQIEKLSIFLRPGHWYMHFWQGDDVIAVFKDKTFEFKHSDKATWQPAIEHGLALGIPEEQLDFPIS